ncbi:MAG: TonB-dependent receptor [Candidatus Omnitrophota bacterium]
MKWFTLYILHLFLVSAAFAQTVDLEPIRVVGEGGYQEVLSSYEPVSLAGDFSGIDIQEFTGYGFLQDVSIRGGIFEDTNTRLNGISLNNPQTGHYHLSLPVVSTDIEGLNADLNRQTLNYNLLLPVRESSFIRMAGGNGGFAESVLSMTRKAQDSFHRFSIEGTRADGLLDETDGFRSAASYTLNHQGSYNDFFLYTAVSEKKFGVGGAYSAPWYMKEEEHLKQELFMAKWTSHKEIDFSIAPYVHRTQDLFLLDRDNPSFYRNDHTTFVSGNIIELYDTQTGRYGTFEFQREDIRSTNLDEHQRFSYAFDAGIKEGEYGGWLYEGGLRARYFDRFPFKLMPHLGVGYRVTNFWKVQIKANRSFRQPSFTELYYDSPTNIGNANLELQQSDNIELGTSYETNEFRFYFDGFYRRQQNTIDWVRDSGAVQYQAINTGKVNVRGFDIGIGTAINLIIFDRMDLAYTRLNVNKEKLYDVSKYVFDYLRDRAVLKLSSGKGKWGWSVNSVYEYHISLGDRIIFSAEGDYRVSNDSRVFIAADNILDEDYEEFSFIQGSPFFIKAGLEMYF